MRATTPNTIKTRYMVFCWVQAYMERECEAPTPEQVAEALDITRNVAQMHMKHLNGADGLAYPTLLRESGPVRNNSNSIVPKHEIDLTLRVLGHNPNAL